MNRLDKEALDEAIAKAIAEYVVRDFALSGNPKNTALSTWSDLLPLAATVRRALAEALPDVEQSEAKMAWESYYYRQLKECARE